MNVAGLTPEALADRLAGPGLGLRVGPFTVRLRSPIASVQRTVASLYPDHRLSGPDDFIDFDVAVGRAGWVRPTAVFRFETNPPFSPLPLHQAPALLEWGLNWCVAAHAHQYLVLHAATVARGDRGLMLAAPSGFGKSTLCAALVHAGWRLLSDELALLRLGDGMLLPIPRPLSLKNRSIEVIRRRVPGAHFGPPIATEHKGILALMRPPAASVAAASCPARPRWVVFPRYAEGAAASLSRESRGRGFIELARNAFNYGALGQAGFAALADASEGAAFYRLEHGDLDGAIRLLDAL
jgi:HprK-related kinase A